MLFSLHIFVIFPAFFLQLISSFIPLKTERMLDMLSIFLNLLRLVLCPTYVLSWRMFHEHLRHFLLFSIRPSALCLIACFPPPSDCATQRSPGFYLLLVLWVLNGDHSTLVYTPYFSLHWPITLTWSHWVLIGSPQLICIAFYKMSGKGNSTLGFSIQK